MNELESATKTANKNPSEGLPGRALKHTTRAECRVGVQQKICASTVGTCTTYQGPEYGGLREGECSTADRPSAAKESCGGKLAN